VEEMGAVLRTTYTFAFDAGLAYDAEP